MATAEPSQEVRAAEAIRARVRFLAAAARGAVAGFLGLDAGEAPPTVSPPALDRFLPQWVHLLPGDPVARRAVARALADRSDPRVLAAWPRLREALALAPPPDPEGAPPDDASDDPLASAEREFEWVSLRRGDLLVREGDP